MSEAINDGGPAFPEPFIRGESYPFITASDVNCGGMSLRDYFAAAALTGMLASQKYANTKNREIINGAWNIANAMLEARTCPTPAK